MTKFVCPNCHSENIQKCSIIYKSGTRTHQSTTTINGNVEAAACYFESQEAEKFNNEEYPALYNQWLNTYICHRCGHKFTLN